MAYQNTHYAGSHPNAPADWFQPGPAPAYWTSLPYYHPAVAVATTTNVISSGSSQEQSHRQPLPNSACASHHSTRSSYAVGEFYDRQCAYPGGYSPGMPTHYTLHPPPGYYRQAEENTARDQGPPNSNHNRRSFYPGHSVRPLGERWPAPGNGYAMPPYPLATRPRPLHQYPPSHVVTSPDMPQPSKKRKYSVAIKSSLKDYFPWIRIKDLQREISMIRNQAFVLDLAPYYSEMHQHWKSILWFIHSEPTREEFLNLENQMVFMTCLLDHNAINHCCLSVALQCLKTLTTMPKQRNWISEENIFRVLVQLLPYASSVIGLECTMDVLRVVLSLLEDELLQDRVKLSQKILSDLSSAISRVWISRHKQESIVQLARRALITINPHYDTEEEVEGGVESTEDCDRNQMAPSKGLEFGETNRETRPAADSCHPENSLGPPVKSNVYRARNVRQKKPSTLVLSKDMYLPRFEERRCAYYPHCIRAAKDCHGWTMGTCMMTSLTPVQEDELKLWKRQMNQQRKAATEANRREGLGKVHHDRRQFAKEDIVNEASL